MRRLAFAVAVSIAAISMAGCKSDSPVQQENADQLTSQLVDASAKYRGTCQIPSEAASKAAVRDAMGSSSPADQETHFNQAQAEAKARLASSECKELAAKRDAISGRLDTVLKQAH